MHKILIVVPLAMTLLATLGCGKDTPMAAQTTTEATPSMPQKVVQLRVNGMSCSGCVNAIVNKVDGLPGVLSCEVSLENRSATVALSDPTAETTVEETIRKLGYTVEPESTNPAS